MNTHLVGQQESKVVMAKDIVCSLIISHVMNNGRGIARLLGVDRWNIKKGMECKILLDIYKDAFWFNYKRRKQIEGLLESLKEIMNNQQTIKSTISPNRMDVARRWIGVRLYGSHPTHYIHTLKVMLMPQFGFCNFVPL